MTWERRSPRRERLPKDWWRLRHAILVRDENRCQWRENGQLCLAPANQVDHIQAGDDDSPANLQALCEYHHKAKSSREGAAAVWDKRAEIKRRFARPQEPHPGRIGN